MTASWLFGAAQREPSMSEITTIGLDLAKHVFQVHGSMRAVGWCCASSCGAARWWRSCGARLQLDHAARGSAATDPPTSGILLRAQPLQDLANHPERAVALSGQHSWNGSELIRNRQGIRLDTSRRPNPLPLRRDHPRRWSNLPLETTHLHEF